MIGCDCGQFKQKKPGHMQRNPECLSVTNYILMRTKKLPIGLDRHTTGWSDSSNSECESNLSLYNV
jgi:hypothetical protein